MRCVARRRVAARRRRSTAPTTNDRQRGDFGKPRAAREHAHMPTKLAAALAGQLEQRAEDERDARRGARGTTRRRARRTTTCPCPRRRTASDRSWSADRYAEPLGEQPRQRGRYRREEDRDRGLVGVVAPDRDQRQHEERRTARRCRNSVRDRGSRPSSARANRSTSGRAARRRRPERNCSAASSEGASWPE